MQTSARTLIAASIEDVYEYVSGLERGAWPPGTVEMELVGGEPGVVGTMYRRVVHDGSHATYAAETSLEADPGGTPVVHPLIEQFFERFEDGAYVRNDEPWGSW